MDNFVGRIAPQLHALVELETQGGHMTRAAETLGVPQSSMSRRIHALQKELGVPLLIQQGRTVQLTPAAILLAHRSRGPLRELADTLTAVSGEGDPDHGTVRFGFPLTMGSGEIPALLAEFHRLAPGVRLHLTQAHGSELTADLRSGALDLAIVIPPPEELHHVLIGTQTIRAALPAGHALAARQRIRLDELRDEIFIANPTSYNLRQLTDSWCRTAGFEPNIRIEITEFATVRELVGRGLGVALLPHDERATPGVVEVPLDSDSYRRGIALAWISAGDTSAVGRMRAFILERSPST